MPTPVRDWVLEEKFAGRRLDVDYDDVGPSTARTSHLVQDRNTDGDDPTDAEALDFVLATIDQTVTVVEASEGVSLQELPLRALSLSWAGGRSWNLNADYARDLASTSEGFDLIGQSEKLIVSSGTTAYAKSGKTAEDFGGLINVDPEDGPQGTDVLRPRFRTTETVIYEDAQITDAYIATLRSMFGTVNNAVFNGYAAGEVLFVGATGRRRADTRWEITFKYDIGINRTNFTIGSITGIDSKAWQYTWVLREQTEDVAAASLAFQPKAVYVEDVYEESSFSMLQPAPA